MGVKGGIFAHLPGGETTRKGFLGLLGIQLILDAAGLMWICALWSSTSYLNENRIPATAEFQRMLQYMVFILKIRMHCAFDGCSTEHKAPENARRDAKRLASGAEARDRISNVPMYVALCAKVCRKLLIDYSVSPEEADTQVFTALKKHPNAWVGTRDGDLLPYGARRIIIFDDWRKEHYRTIDLTSFGPSDLTKYPLLRHYLDHGPIVFQLWAGCHGCDFTENEHGLDGIGTASFFDALDALDEDEELLPSTIAPHLKAAAGGRTKLTVDEIENDLSYIVSCFTEKIRMYDEEGNIVDASGKVHEQKSECTIAHIQLPLPRHSNIT